MNTDFIFYPTFPSGIISIPDGNVGTYYYRHFKLIFSPGKYNILSRIGFIPDGFRGKLRTPNLLTNPLTRVLPCGLILIRDISGEGAEAF